MENTSRITPMFTADMRRLEEQIGHVFANKDLLILALTHKSYSKTNYERLEFLGDSILGLVVAEYLYLGYPNLAEGEMSRIRSAMVREDALAIISNHFGLNKLMLVDPHAFKHDIPVSALADAVEAIFAAIYLDAGMDKVRPVIMRTINFLVEKKHVSFEKDPKTQLQELLQSRGVKVPTYSYTHEGLRHFAKCAVPELKLETTGTGTTRKEADRMAAQKALTACQPAQRSA